MVGFEIDALNDVRVCKVANDEGGLWLCGYHRTFALYDDGCRWHKVVVYAPVEKRFTCTNMHDCCEEFGILEGQMLPAWARTVESVFCQMFCKVVEVRPEKELEGILA